MEESTLRWPTDKEREEMEEVCYIGEVPHTCGLTAEDRDQLRKIRSFRVWDHLFLDCVSSWHSTGLNSSYPL